MIYIYILTYILLNTLDQLPGEWPARFTCADWAGGRGFEGEGGGTGTDGHEHRTMTQATNEHERGGTLPARARWLLVS